MAIRAVCDVYRNNDPRAMSWNVEVLEYPCENSHMNALSTAHLVAEGSQEDKFIGQYGTFCLKFGELLCLLLIFCKQADGF